MIGGEAGLTVSRNWISARSSIRAPFREMLPLSRGVLILMRGVAAIAVSRETTVDAEAGCFAAGAVADGVGVLACGVALPGVACGDGLASSAWVCCRTRCRSICGTL